MIKIKRLIALLNGADLTPQTSLEAAVKAAMAKVGGGGAMIVTLTEDDGAWSADKTAEEIATAAVTMDVIAVIDDDGDLTVLQLVEAGEGKDDEYYADFAAVVNEDEGTAVLHAQIEDDEVEVETVPLALGLLVMTGTFGEDANHKKTITLNKTAEELFVAAEAGRMGKVTLSVPAGQDKTMTVTAVLPCESFKSEYEGTTTYTFKVRCDAADADTLYYATQLAASDTVVLTEV